MAKRRTQRSTENFANSPPLNLFRAAEISVPLENGFYFCLELKSAQEHNWRFKWLDQQLVTDSVSATGGMIETNKHIGGGTPWDLTFTYASFGISVSGLKVNGELCVIYDCYDHEDHQIYPPR